MTIGTFNKFMTLGAIIIFLLLIIVGIITIKLLPFIIIGILIYMIVKAVK